jgi:Cys-tRNA synthase (O-phospho-L-seryl-tRNA:Cys-tRNA synthase)
MPIEIKELVIKAVVASGNDQQAETVLNPADILKLKKEIAKEVTERVLKTLKQKSER